MADSQSFYTDRDKTLNCDAGFIPQMKRSKCCEAHMSVSIQNPEAIFFSLFLIRYFLCLHATRSPDRLIVALRLRVAYLSCLFSNVYEFMSRSLRFWLILLYFVFKHLGQISVLESP